MKFVIKLFPEITIKSKPVRQRLARQLRQNISEVLKREHGRIGVQGFWDKIEVYVSDENPELGKQVAQTLQRIPGIANILRVQTYTIENMNEGFEEISALTNRIMLNQIKNKTFVVRIKRVGIHHTFTSTEIERYVGGGLLQHGESLGVNLRNPDITIRLEIRGTELYIVEERYEGLGGFPIGTQDDVLSLISGGFDSTVSSYLSMKRGLKTHFCFFNLFMGKIRCLTSRQVCFRSL
jgi:thiamine biosynthesis protein ThiI